MLMFFLGFLAGVLLTLFLANLTSGEKHLEQRIDPAYGIDEPQFLRSIGTLLGSPIVEGNRVEQLINGDQIFPAMLAAIRGARRTLTFETFIYWSGQIGRDFAEAVSERARAGVRVHILLDFMGSIKMEKGLLESMREAGCEIVKYHPPKWHHLSRLNNRTHRKLLIVDGEIGFTGGVGIAQEWTGNAQDAQHWRDSHFRVTGPVVAQMQAVFMANWIKTRSTVEHTEPYFPQLGPAGGHRAQIFHSSPQEGSENIRLMYLLSLAAAKKSLLLEQAYFVPDDLAIDMLAAAAKRGVRVEAIVPGPMTDAPLVRRASRARWGKLLEAGVRFFEYMPTNFHCKIMIVDGVWSSVGSTNFDSRSFRLNDEANLNIHDREFAAELEKTFEQDKLRCREITLEEWRRRPALKKIQERFWALFHKQM